MTPRAAIVESSIVLDGVRTRTLAVGGEGPRVLLLHGFTDSADCWRPVLAELSALGRAAVAVDLPGYGKAEPAPEVPGLESLDRFIAAFVRAHSNGSADALVGNSLGGLLALRAAQRPDLPLVGVAAISPAGLAYHRRMELLEYGVRGLRPLLWLLSQLPLPRTVLRFYAEWLYNHRLAPGVTDPSVARYYASHYRGMRDIQRFVTEFLALAEADRSDPIAFERIGVPVLLIWGGRDAITDVKGAQLVLEAVGSSRLVVFEGCGHCAQVQRPAEIARLIADLPASADPAADDLTTTGAST